VEEEYYEESEDDGLGYYNDGVKRTLTDEQIAIFRHSEIQALLRERRHAEEAKGDKATPLFMSEEVLAAEAVVAPLSSTAKEELKNRDLHETLVDATSTSTSTPTPPPEAQASKCTKANKRRAANKKTKKAQEARERGWFKSNVKPDLRKRTWDKVDSGMESLDYDDESSAVPGSNPAPQRRRISYDD